MPDHRGLEGVRRFMDRHVGSLLAESGWSRRGRSGLHSGSGLDVETRRFLAEEEIMERVDFFRIMRYYEDA